jgi:hypothetical protein
MWRYPVFRAAVFSIVLAVSAGPDAALLCKVLCDSAPVAASGCHRKDVSPSLNVAGTDNCGSGVVGGALLFKEDPRRGASDHDARSAVVVPRYQFVPATYRDVRADGSGLGSSPEPEPLLTALRI